MAQGQVLRTLQCRKRWMAPVSERWCESQLWLRHQEDCHEHHTEPDCDDEEAVAKRQNGRFCCDLLANSLKGAGERRQLRHAPRFERLRLQGMLIQELLIGLVDFRDEVFTMKQHPSLQQHGEQIHAERAACLHQE